MKRLGLPIDLSKIAFPAFRSVLKLSDRLLLLHVQYLKRFNELFPSEPPSGVFSKRSLKESVENVCFLEMVKFEMALSQVRVQVFIWSIVGSKFEFTEPAFIEDHVVEAILGAFYCQREKSSDALELFARRNSKKGSFHVSGSEQILCRFCPMLRIAGYAVHPAISPLCFPHPHSRATYSGSCKRTVNRSVSSGSCSVFCAFASNAIARGRLSRSAAA